MEIVGSIQLTTPTAGLFIGAVGGNVTTLSNGSPSTSIILTLPTISDTLVARTTTDTLTNKTIIGSTNTVRATQLATTGADVTLSAQNPPTTGQILTATSATTAAFASPANNGTTSTTATLVTSNASTTTIETIPVSTSSQTYYIINKVVGYSTTSSVGAALEQRAAFVNIAGTVTQIQTTTQFTWIGAAPFTVSSTTFTISGTNILVQVTGAVANSINWRSATTLQTDV